MGVNGVNLDGIKQVDTLVRQNPAMGKCGSRLAPPGSAAPGAR